MSFLQNFTNSEPVPMEIDTYSTCKLCGIIIYESEEEIYCGIVTSKHYLLWNGFCAFCIEFLYHSRFFLSRLTEFVKLIAFIERVHLEYRERNNFPIIRYPALFRFIAQPSIGNFKIVVDNNLLSRKYALSLKWIKLLNRNKIFIRHSTCLHSVNNKAESEFFHYFFLSPV
jgi:hypothetical protein